MNEWNHIMVEGFCFWNFKNDKPEDYYFSSASTVPTTYTPRPSYCQKKIGAACLGPSRGDKCPYLGYADVDKEDFNKAMGGLYGSEWKQWLFDKWETIKYKLYTGPKTAATMWFKADTTCPECHQRTYYVLNTQVPYKDRSDPGLFTFCEKNYCMIPLSSIPKDYVEHH